MTTTIAPSIGHAPLLTQAGTGASPGYDAVDFRRLSTVGLQEGVLGVSSYEVTQRGAGANMSVDIAASTADALGTGVAALIQGDAVTAQGLYPVPPHSAVINETVTAAHATLPRVDAVILELLDNTHDASGSNLVRTRIVAGTATSGATLDNARDGSHGGAAIPSSALHLADVLVGGGVTSITNSVIRDRRKWARGAYCRIVRNANAAAGTNYTTTSANLALIDSTNIAPRVECSGAPVRVRLQGVVSHSASGSDIYITPVVDNAGVDGAGDVGETGAVSNATWIFRPPATAIQYPASLTWEFVPAAGSHIIAPAWATSASTATLNANATGALLWTIEEIVRQNTKNNGTTTG